MQRAQVYQYMKFDPIPDHPTVEARRIESKSNEFSLGIRVVNSGIVSTNPEI